MAKRVSIEEQVITFFQTAPLADVEKMQITLKTILKNRPKSETVTDAPAPARATKKVRSKSTEASATAATATAVAPQPEAAASMGETWLPQ